jgi:integrase
MRSLDEQVWIKAAGVSARTLQKWLGHASLETTLAYLEAADIRSERTREQVNNSFAVLRVEPATATVHAC